MFIYFVLCYIVGLSVGIAIAIIFHKAKSNDKNLGNLIITKDSDGSRYLTLATNKKIYRAKDNDKIELTVKTVDVSRESYTAYNENFVQKEETNNEQKRRYVDDGRTRSKHS